MKSKKKNKYIKNKNINKSTIIILNNFFFFERSVAKNIQTTFDMCQQNNKIIVLVVLNIGRDKSIKNIIITFFPICRSWLVEGYRWFGMENIRALSEITVLNAVHFRE